MTGPVLTIITPVFNGRRFIEGCLRNFIEQDCQDAVHLVMDGGSTDGTPELVREWMTRSPRLELVSERDRGQSHAMNKAIALARTEYIGFLNADDFYEPGTLNRVASLIRGLERPAMLVGNCNVRIENDEIEWVQCPSLLGIEYLVMGPPLCYIPLNPSAYFYPKQLHDLIGPYDEDEHFQMDLKFMLKAVQAIPTIYHDEIWGNFRLLPGTKTFQHQSSGKQLAAMRKVYLKTFVKLPLSMQLRVIARYMLWSAARQIDGWRKRA